MEAALFLAVIAVYTVIYYATKFVARKAFQHGKDATAPRVYALLSVIAASIVLAFWMRDALVDQALYNSLRPFEQGEYVGRIVGIALVPAVLAAFVIVYRIVKARRRLRHGMLEKTA